MLTHFSFFLPHLNTNQIHHQSWNRSPPPYLRLHFLKIIKSSPCTSYSFRLHPVHCISIIVDSIGIFLNFAVYLSSLPLDKLANNQKLILLLYSSSWKIDASLYPICRVYWVPIHELVSLFFVLDVSVFVTQR